MRGKEDVGCEETSGRQAATPKSRGEVSFVNAKIVYRTEPYVVLRPPSRRIALRDFYAAL